MKPGDAKTETRTESFYVIMLTITSWNLRSSEVNHVVFKADRYSSYSGRLQVEHNPEDGRKWKTAEGAAGALKRMIEKGYPIKPEHKPVVCCYTRTVIHTETLDIVGEVSHEEAGKDAVSSR